MALLRDRLRRPLTEPVCRQVRQLSGSGEGPGPGPGAAGLPEAGRKMANRTRASRCHQPGGRGNGEQDQPLTATAAANRCHQRPATAQNSRTIRANWGYVRPEKQTVGEPVPCTSPGRAMRRAAGRYSSKVQQRPLTATSTSYHPRPALAGTADKRPAAPLVRDQEADRVMIDRDQLKITFDSGGTVVQQARPEYPDELSDELVRLASLRPLRPRVGKLARSLR